MMIQFPWQSCSKEALVRGLATIGLFAVVCLTAGQIARVVSYAPLPEVNLTEAPGPDKSEVQYAALFGPLDAKDKPLQESGLNAQLLGVFATQDPSQGSAVISISGRKPSLVPVGERLPGGILLKEVYPDYIVLEQAGERSILRLPVKRL
jgi:type II secretory pathway component PulC